MRELVIVLNRQSCLDQLSKCAVADHEGPSTSTAKCVPPVRLAKDAKLEKPSSKDHDDSVIRSEPAVPRTSRYSQRVDVDGVEDKPVQVTLTRDPKLDRLALKNGTSDNSDEGFARRRNSKNGRRGSKASGRNGREGIARRRNSKNGRRGSKASGRNGREGFARRRNSKNGRRGSKASGRNGRKDAMLVENITKEVFLSHLSLSPYYHMDLRTRKSFQKLLETSTQRSKPLGLRKQIKADRNIRQNPNSKRQIHVLIERNDVIDRLALQPVAHSVCLNNFEFSKVNNCRIPLKTVRKVVPKRTAGQDQLAAESASVPPTPQYDRVEFVSSGTTDHAEETPCLKNLSIYNIGVSCTDQVRIRTSGTVVSEPPRELQEMDVNSNVIMDQNMPRAQSGGQQDEFISFEPPAKGLLSLNTRNNTSAHNLPEISGQEKCEASPVPITAAARAIKSEERRRNYTGLSSNSGAPHDLNSTLIIKLKRVTGDNWAVVPACPNAPVSSVTAGTATGARSRTVFVKLRRDSNIDRLALVDSKSTAFQPPSHNEWPKVTVDAEIHHNENESPRKNSIPPSRTIRKRFAAGRNSRKKNKLIRKKFGCQNYRPNFSEVSSNSVSQYMAVKKPLRVRSDFDSINIDPPTIGS